MMFYLLPKGEVFPAHLRILPLSEKPMSLPLHPQKPCPI